MHDKPASGYNLLFFLSGATGLVYELLWVRLLYQSFGSTIQSVTTVVAAYIGGLGLGAWLLGARADRHPKPAAFYGQLEFAIGLFGIVSPFVLALAHQLYLRVAGAFALSGAPSVAVRFGIAALVLLVPTTLMGGTLPVLTRAFTGADRASLQPALARLYGLNTLGAVLGTAITGFILIEHVGIRATLWGTAILNLAIGATALALSGSPGSVRRRQRPRAAPTSGEAERTPGEHLPIPTGFRYLTFALLAITALASLLDEIAWTRVLVMIVGGSTYAFTLILLVLLLGMGVGSALVAGHPVQRGTTAAHAALAQGITVAGAALLFVLFSALPTYIVSVFQMPHWGATARLFAMGGVVGAVVLVPALGMGMTFPLLTDLVARDGDARATDVGRAYALNSLGGIAGTVLTGFVLVAMLGTNRTLRLGVLLHVGATLALAAIAIRANAGVSADSRRRSVRVLVAGGLAVVGFAIAIVTPRFDTRLFDLGPTIYARRPMDAAARRAFLGHRGARQLAFREGRNATVSVWENEVGRTLRVNGKTDASDYADMDTEIMLGLAPVVAHPHARSALAIGYGSGVTARVLATAPGMERVRLVEIEPVVLAMDRWFIHVNDSILHRPAVSVVVDDARSALQLSRERFDVIVSEPSNPWAAGVATLYTPDFFRIVRSRLADGGVFCQWVQLYQLPLPVVAGIVLNMRAVFPHVEVWFGSPRDLMVLGSLQEMRYDPTWVREVLAPGTPLADLGREWLGLDGPANYFGRYLLGERGVESLLQRATLVHTDDRPALEFVAARRFLDPEGGQSVFDSLVAIGGETGDHGDPLLFVEAVTSRPDDPIGLRYAEALHHARPAEPEWTVRVAAIRLSLGDTAFAESALAAVSGRGAPVAEALLLRGNIAAARADIPSARALLVASLTAGGDTAHAHASLAALATHAARWDQAVAEARAALDARGTFRHPVPWRPLTDALTRLALDGPPLSASNLLDQALRRLPASWRLHDLAGVAAIRAGRCDRAAGHFLALVDFGVWRDNAPALLAGCRQGVTPPPAELLAPPRR